MKQIDDDLLFDLIKYHVLAKDNNGANYELFRTSELEARIQKGLSEKWIAWQKQDAFKKYKTSKDPAEREANRTRYLDLQGILEDFRR